MSAMISAGLLASIPTLPTRRALMVLDLQKDFTGSNGKCYVPNIDEFVGDLLAVLPVFRDAGDLVFWVTTEFQCKRPVFDPESGSDSIVLGATDYDNEESDTEDEEDGVDGVDSTQARSSRKPKKVQPPVAQDVEAFLSSTLKSQQRCCFPGTEGCEYMDQIQTAIDKGYDDEIQKSQYSAFKRDLRNERESILSILQANLVTELFLCGSMSNISVYATALDAVRHGFKVTIIEDAVGYRSERRHEEAMRQMADLMGANGVTCAELVGEFEESQTDRRALSYQAKSVKAGHPSRKSKEPVEDHQSKSSSPLVAASSPPASTPATQATIPSTAANSPAPLFSISNDLEIPNPDFEDEKENKHPASEYKLQRTQSRSSKHRYDDESKDPAERKISPKRDTRGKVLEPTHPIHQIKSEQQGPESYFSGEESERTQSPRKTQKISPR